MFGTYTATPDSISSFSKDILQVFLMANRSDSSSDGDSSRSTFDEVETSIEELLSKAEDSPKIEGPPSKRSRKVPARFKDSACTPNTTRVLEEFDTLMKDSKSN